MSLRRLPGVGMPVQPGSDEEPEGAFDQLLEPAQPPGGYGAVDRPVVDAEDDLDELREPDAPVVGLDRQGGRRADGEDPGLGWVDDGRELLDAEHAEVGDSQGAAFEFLLPQAAGAGSGREILDRRRD